MISDCEVVPTIPARDLDASCRFYEEVLGLKRESEDASGVSYRCGSSGIYLYETPHAGTAQHTLCTFVSEQLDDDMRELKEHGVRFEVYPEMQGVEWDGDVARMDETRGVWFRDPADNILGMFEQSRVLSHR